MKLPQGIRRNSSNTQINTKGNWNANMANKGMDLEKMVNNSNEYYLANDIAVIHKKPIPIQIVKVNYPDRSKAVITEAYYKLPSTTDYNGVYKGYYIDFDAKECSSLTSFPLSNVHEHQYKHLQNITRHGGIGFLLVSFNKYDEYYLLTIDQFLELLNSANNGERKSIPYTYFKENCIKIEATYQPELDYLKAVDILINRKNSSK